MTTAVSISEMSMDEQSKTIASLARRAIELLKSNAEWAVNGAPIPDLIEKLASESSRSNREAYYAIQFGFHSALLRESDGLLTAVDELPAVDE